ncbi:MAG: prepilin-type N-terminal cleavage/methylation domain-containing protein [Deltaproteobacteria bacterium]|nr:prepilin-type N-terminal cleavage/methylation domain-containing protein [Deltaproteobacteria bacterium]
MSKKQQHNDSATGFSLVELLVTIGIVSVLMAVATPVIIAWLPNLRLQSDARQLVSNLQKARLEAVKRDQCVGIVFTTVPLPATGGGYKIFLDDGSGMGTACNGKRDETISNADATLIPPLDTITMSRSVSLTAANIGGGTFSFTPRGVIRGSQSGNIQLKNTKVTYTATVSAAGNIQLSKN